MTDDGDLVYVGDMVVITNTWKTLDPVSGLRVPTDPSLVQVVYQCGTDQGTPGPVVTLTYDPAAGPSGAIVRVNQGSYQASFPVTAPGELVGYWQGTGTAQAMAPFRETVYPSPLPAVPWPGVQPPNIDPASPGELTEGL